MATIVELEEQGLLFRYDPVLGSHDHEERSLYLLPRLKLWMEEVLPGLESTWRVELSPLEQMDSLLEVFCSGQTITLNKHFKPLTYLGEGIWQLKTPDLRVFGWFHIRDRFIGAAADLADTVKQYRLYRHYCEQAARDRDRLDLDHPRFITGASADDVVSAFD